MADVLYQQHDHLAELRKRAQKDMIAEARKHPEYRFVRSCPGLGDVRAALLLPVVVTPYRFANKRQFWSYCGLAVVSRSSSDWVRTKSGEWIKAPVQQTRGLNKNFNRTLKAIFKGAAITVIGQRRDTPLCDLDSGTYHDSRTHLALGKDAPEPRAIQSRHAGAVVSEPVLGGLHHRYWRQAA